MRNLALADVPAPEPPSCPIPAWHAASSSITTVQTKHFDGQVQRVLPAVVRRTKSEYDRLDVPPTLSDVHGQLYGSVSSLKRVRCIEAAVA